MIRTRGVAHFTIPVTDTRRAEAFYTGTLGLAVVQSNHERGMVFLDSGGDCIILARVEGPISTAREADIHHAFVVDHEDYAPSLEALRAGGVDILFEEDRQGGAVNGPRLFPRPRRQRAGDHRFDELQGRRRGLTPSRPSTVGGRPENKAAAAPGGAEGERPAVPP